MSKMIEEDSLKVPLKNNHVSSTLSHRTNSAQSPAMLTKESSILTLDEIAYDDVDVRRTEEDTLSFNHQKIARTTAFSQQFTGIVALNTLQVSELDQCDSLNTTHVMFSMGSFGDRVANRPHGEKEHINYFRDCMNVGNDDDSYGQYGLIFSRLDTIVHLQIGGATWFGAGIASLLFTVLSIAHGIEQQQNVYRAETWPSDFSQFFQCSLQSFPFSLVWDFTVRRFRFFRKRAHTHTHTGLNFHDPYDGHA